MHFGAQVIPTGIFVSESVLAREDRCRYSACSCVMLECGGDGFHSKSSCDRVRIEFLCGHPSVESEWLVIFVCFDFEKPCVLGVI